jgi:capsular exopolysaccharide synthesis family protein
LGKKVLLIGADLRNPQIEKYLNLNKNPKGLSDYLYINEMKWEDAISKCPFYPDNLDILSSGTTPPNPANLLVNGKFKLLIEDAKANYDYIIVDTAPTLLVSDTKLIINHADALIILCRINHTEKELLRHIKDTITQFRSNNVAVLLNHSYCKFNKKYNYGYEYGYTQNA